MNNSGTTTPSTLSNQPTGDQSVANAAVMTERSKPTPGPWVVYDVNPVIVLADRYSVGGFAVATCHPVRKVTQEQAEANARLISEAGTVHHETGLTPQQMREQRDELLALLKVALTCIGECHSYRSHLHFKEEKQIKDALERISKVEGRS